MGVVGSSILGIGRSREKYFKFLIGFQFVALGHCEKRKGEGGGGNQLLECFGMMFCKMKGMIMC